MSLYHRGRGAGEFAWPCTQLLACAPSGALLHSLASCLSAVYGDLRVPVMPTDAARPPCGVGAGSCLSMGHPDAVWTGLPAPIETRLSELHAQSQPEGRRRARTRPRLAGQLRRILHWVFFLPRALESTVSCGVERRLCVIIIRTRPCSKAAASRSISDVGEGEGSDGGRAQLSRGEGSRDTGWVEFARTARGGPRGEVRARSACRALPADHPAVAMREPSRACRGRRRRRPRRCPDRAFLQRVAVSRSGESLAAARVREVGRKAFADPALRSMQDGPWAAVLKHALLDTRSAARSLGRQRFGLGPLDCRCRRRPRDRHCPGETESHPRPA